MCGRLCGRIKPQTVKLVFVDKHTVSTELEQRLGWLGIGIMCLSGVICLPTNYCFSELALYKSN
jgi:hypothetical protein